MCLFLVGKLCHDRNMRNGFLIRNTVWNCNYDNNGIDKIEIQMVSISSSFSPQQTCYTVTWRYLWYSCFFSLRHMSSCITIRYTILSVILLIFLRCTVEKYCRIGTLFFIHFWILKISNQNYSRQRSCISDSIYNYHFFNFPPIL